MKKYVLILGTQDDSQSVYMKNKLQDFGVIPIIIDSRYFPDYIKVTFNTNTPADGYFILDGFDKKVEFFEIAGVYYRKISGVPFPKEQDRLLMHVMQWNNEAYFKSFLTMLDCNWVNSVRATENHHIKPYHLQLLKKNGFLIPDTLITGDVEEIKKAADETDKKYIVKPVRGWANTELLTKNLLDFDNIEQMVKKSPVTLQEYIKGENIRIYVIGDEVLPVKIITDDIDSRQNTDNVHIKIEIPKDAELTMRNAAKLLDFKFTAIDTIKSEDGKYYILEANATPVFINDEIASKFPISEKICKLLIE